VRLALKLAAIGRRAEPAGAGAATPSTVAVRAPTAPAAGPAPTAPAAGRAPTVPAAGPAPSAAPAPDAELLAQRERLTQRFALMQSELGGLFYEMAIRDHVRLDVLAVKAAALQRVDAELAQVEHLLGQGAAELGGRCPSCGAVHARGAAFCSQCATPLAPA
jgi:hypothetical protein